MSNRIDLYPIVIIEDRYSGVYSGGAWLAIAKAEDYYEGRERRGEFCLYAGPNGSDPEAHAFGAQIPYIDWIATGETPDEALSNLKAKNPK